MEALSNTVSVDLETEMNHAFMMEPSKNSRFGRASLLGNAPCHIPMLSHIDARKVRLPTTQRGENNGICAFGASLDSALCAFPLARFNLYHFPMVNRNWV